MFGTDQIWRSNRGGGRGDMNATYIRNSGQTVHKMLMRRKPKFLVAVICGPLLGPSCNPWRSHDATQWWTLLIKTNREASSDNTKFPQRTMIPSTEREKTRSSTRWWSGNQIEEREREGRANEGTKGGWTKIAGETGQPWWRHRRTKGMGDNDSDDAIDVMRDSDEPAKVAHLTHIASTDIIVLLGLLWPTFSSPHKLTCGNHLLS